jgi:NADPH:quinone reductase-like Zn-dependent oxidoreductase
LRGPKAAVLGNEFAGQIEAVGTGVTSFSVRDRVFGYNEGPFGAHAELLVVSETASVAAIPDGRTYAEMAPGTEGVHYALSAINAAGIRRGQQVLVNGGTGGIGSAAIQLLRIRGAGVTAVCGPEHLDLVRELGAATVLDRSVDDFTRLPGPFAVVIDAVGKSTFGRCRPLLEPRGIYLSTELGPKGQNPLLAVVTPLLRGKRVKFPIPRHNQQMVRNFAALIDSGQFTPVVDRTFPFDQIVDAYRYVETGQKIGNVVLTMGTTDH